MRCLILLLVCALLSGCSLFKRVDKRTDKHEQFEKTEQLTKTDKSTAVKEIEQSSIKEIEQTTERDMRDLDNNTSIEADEILIDSQGNISAKGNAKVKSKTKDKGVAEKASNKEVVSDVSKQTAIDTKEQKEERAAQENKQSDIHSERKEEPSGWGLIIGTVCALLFVFGMLWYFGIKPKKN